MTTSLEVRFRAISHLQTIQAKNYSDPHRYEQAEHAIDLALSERREVNSYLVRNLLRDSKRTLVRQSATRRYVAIADNLPSTDEDGSPQHEVKLLGDATTPEAILSVAQLTRFIIDDVSRSSQHAARVMEGLLSGESHAETALAAGISPARVNQIRRALRKAATTYLEVGNSRYC